MNYKTRREVEHLEEELEYLQFCGNRINQPDLNNLISVQAQILESRSLDELKKLLHVKDQQLIRQDKEFRPLITEAKKVAAQVGAIYILLYIFLNLRFINKNDS